MFGRKKLMIPKCVAVTSAICISLLMNAQTYGQQVSVQVSSKEAYVGSPIVLQIKISNATDYKLPEEIEIDACDVRTAGPASQSSQVMIYNGRRSETRSVTQQYLVTPRIEGRFTVPELRITVNGNQKRTQPIEFVATKSETGDLLFAEIVGKKDKVYVGQPLDLTLRIWVKPFIDRDKEVKLNEGNMWQMLSDSTNWGPFQDRIQQMAQLRQRPGGESVLRENREGADREYYLFEIDATVYPTKPGKIDGDDVQVVVDYPTELGRSRNPFGSILGGSGSSMMRQMMEDDFFSGSSFGRRLTVTKTRPIVANAEVDSTEVLPVPIAGKPENYRGAVGRYSILTEAEPTEVNAGDPITLRIGIIGDGPMDLVQAPPLSQVSSLTEGFKVPDQSLAGFVQDDTKVFVTTIRPRNASVTEIPQIPFNFFDPEKESYQTVYSNPISITVNEAETLAMDSIVSNLTLKKGNAEQTSRKSDGGSLPDLRNDYSANVLLSGSKSIRTDWLLWFIYPFFGWLAVVVFRTVKIVAANAKKRLRSPLDQAIALIGAATDVAEIQTAFSLLIGGRSKAKVDSAVQAVGLLRTNGHMSEANELELLFEELNRFSHYSNESQFSDAQSKDWSLLQEKAVSIANTIEVAFAESSIDLIRRRKLRSGKKFRRSVATVLAFAFLSSSVTAQGIIDSKNADPEKQVAELTQDQLKSIFNSANQAYQRGEEVQSADAVGAVEFFENSAQGYQAVIDQGGSSERLYINLANAYWRSHDLPRAIANYHRALNVNPNSKIANRNLSAAENQLAKATQSTRNEGSSLTGKGWDGRIVDLLGRSSFLVLFAISSVAFWVVASVRTLGKRFPFWRIAAVPATCVLVCGFALFSSEQQEEVVAISVVDTLQLRAGDGKEFDVQSTIESASGKKFRVLNVRNSWVRVCMNSGDMSQPCGWVPASKVEVVAFDL